MGSEKNRKANNGENEEEQEAFLHPLANDQLQALTVDSSGGDDTFNGEVSTSKSFSHYRSAMNTLSSFASSEHSLSPPPSIATTAADSDPLRSPLQNSSLDSPSYADVMFNQFLDRLPESNGNGEINGEATDAAVSSPLSQSSSSEYLRISVSNPQKEFEPSNSIVPGGNTYTSYLITTSTNILDYEGSDFSVRRRFKDIVTLSDRLSEGYRGFLIPPRPDKSLVESQVMQKQEFLEQRRVELEKYLRRLARHPVVRKSDELRVFLTVHGRMPLPTSIDMASRMLDGAARLPKQLLGESSSVIEPQDVVHSAKGGRDMLRFFKELKQYVVNDWGNVRPSVEEEDKEFLEKKEKLRDLEQQLTNASNQVSLYPSLCFSKMIVKC